MPATAAKSIPSSVPLRNGARNMNAKIAPSGSVIPDNSENRKAFRLLPVAI